MEDDSKIPRKKEYPWADPTQPHSKDPHTKTFHKFNIVWYWEYLLLIKMLLFCFTLQVHI